MILTSVRAAACRLFFVVSCNQLSLKLYTGFLGRVKLFLTFFCLPQSLLHLALAPRF
jgi:hypothetical protein